MDSLIKEVVGRGNSGGIYLPKSWVGQRVVVQPLNAKDMILSALAPHMAQISGAYLYGSYARGEETEGSDIDVLVVTEEKMPQKIGLINIESGSLRDIQKKTASDPVGYYSMIQEAVPIMNSSLLTELRKIKPGRKAEETYLDHTESALRVVRGLLDQGGSDQSGAVYSLILRLRGLYILRCRNEETTYSRKGLENYVREKGLDKERFQELYGVYLQVKIEGRQKKTVRVRLRDAEKLFEITSNLLKELRG